MIGSASTIQTRTRAFTLAGIRTKTIPIWDGRISSTQPPIGRTAGGSHSNAGLSLILWEIVEDLLEDVRPTYQYAKEEP